jgi:hypothetical protein
MHIPAQQLCSVSDFYRLMAQTVPVRRAIVGAAERGRSIAPGAVDCLQNALQSLTTLPTDGTSALLALNDTARSPLVHLDLRYEIEELRRDVIFAQRGEAELDTYLHSVHPHFDQQVQTLVAPLREHPFVNLVTDRDGTINNYCSHYLSSIQSAYNALYLCRYARTLRTALILTSAPLLYGGLADISTSPAHRIVLAGSKGRDYIDRYGHHHTLPLPPQQRAMLDKLNNHLEKLLSQSAYLPFTLIGSGFQRKVGQTTIARQDLGESIPRADSDAFLQRVVELVQQLDPGGESFGIHDTTKDIEITLTIPAKPGEPAREFDKGDGVRLLDKFLNLRIAQYPTLICGDTASDLPMVEAALALNPTQTRTIFVTTSPQLRERVARLSASALFADTPDVLITALGVLRGMKG